MEEFEFSETEVDFLLFVEGRCGGFGFGLVSGLGSLTHGSTSSCLFWVWFVGLVWFGLVSWVGLGWVELGWEG